MNKVTTFLKEVRQELKTATWPKKADVTEGTTVVMVMTLITAVFLMLVDMLFNTAITETLFK